MGFDWTRSFIKENPGLIPADETVLAVSWAIPRDDPRGRQLARTAAGMSYGTQPLLIQLRGEAAKWPHNFARDPDRPDRWSLDQRWIFLVVVTDKQLHAYGGRAKRWWRKTAKALPEGATFPRERIAEIQVAKKTHWVKELTIVFQDGSSIALNVANDDAFLTAIHRLPARGGADALAR